MVMITVDEASVYLPKNPYIPLNRRNEIGTWILLRDFIWIYNTFQTHNLRSMQMERMLRQCVFLSVEFEHNTSMDTLYEDEYFLFTVVYSFKWSGRTRAIKYRNDNYNKITATWNECLFKNAASHFALLFNFSFYFICVFWDSFSHYTDRRPNEPPWCRQLHLWIHNFDLDKLIRKMILINHSSRLFSQHSANQTILPDKTNFEKVSLRFQIDPPPPPAL